MASTWERQTKHQLPVLFTGPKIVGALIHASIAPVILYCLQNDVGSDVVRSVGTMLLGKSEDDNYTTTPVTGDRIWFYTMLSTFYGLRWVLGMFTANGGGPMPWGGTLFASIAHLTLLQTVPLTILSVTKGGIPSELNELDYVAGFLWVTAGILQHGSELQRLLFKRQPHNKGQVHMGGLFRYARFINVTGHFLHEVAMAVAVRSLVWVVFCLVIPNYLFFQLAPETDAHMHKKYGEKYEKYVQQTPCKFIPWLW